MKKTALVVATVGALALGSLTSSPAEARWGGWHGGWGWGGPAIGAGLLAGAVVGGIAASTWDGGWGPGWGWGGPGWDVAYEPAYYSDWGYAPAVWAPPVYTRTVWGPRWGWSHRRVIRTASWGGGWGWRHRGFRSVAWSGPSVGYGHRRGFRSVAFGGSRVGVGHPRASFAMYRGSVGHRFGGGMGGHWHR